jgi:hypothetical protein
MAQIKRIKVHPSVTTDRVMEAVERRMFSLDNPGFCIACGEEAEGCEPDAREYECEFCGKPTVYGSDELLMGFNLPDGPTEDGPME